MGDKASFQPTQLLRGGWQPLSSSLGVLLVRLTFCCPRELCHAITDLCSRIPCSVAADAGVCSYSGASKNIATQAATLAVCVQLSHPRRLPIQPKLV